MGPLLIPWYFCQLVIKYAIKRDTPCSKADTLLRFAEPEVVLTEHSLPQLSILETFRYNKEYE